MMGLGLPRIPGLNPGSARPVRSRDQPSHESFGNIWESFYIIPAKREGYPIIPLMKLYCGWLKYIKFHHINNYTSSFTPK